MAICIALLLGFKIPMNFNAPLTADSMTDFWRRWHISLSTWIRDYVYISLGGNRHGTLRMYLNQMVAMTACGLWHGASLNFVVWGVLHGALVCLHKFWSQTVMKHDRHYHPFRLVTRISECLDNFQSLDYLGSLLTARIYKLFS